MAVRSDSVRVMLVPSCPRAARAVRAASDVGEGARQRCPRDYAAVTSRLALLIPVKRGHATVSGCS
ncbi:hypothetical protein DMO24_13740 [Modestobacter versicolor]|uniref:Uncharacterized protein n=1 Tax=Modestobacter versicolor TaxID=429133 RepID=A0A323V7D1_9ACTN|nr:hypothetical protein DMO24_13740 [Modestobacter versicolor]